MGAARAGASIRVVLLDEYQDTSVAQALLLTPAVRAERGHPVTAVGDPNQAIYGWRGASVSNILRFGEDFPRGRRRGAVAKFPLTVNRRSDGRILEVANALAAPLLRRAHRPGRRPLEPRHRRRPGEVRVAVHETYADELGWLRRRRCSGACTAWPSATWSEIGVLVRDNAHAADVFDALTAAEIPVEIVGLKGLLALPEVAEVRRHAHPARTTSPPTPPLLTLLTGPRWAIGPRDLALLGRARPRARRRAGRAAATTQRRSTRSSRARSRGADPTEVAVAVRRAGRPGDLRLLRRGAASASPCWRPSCASCAATPASRCSTWSGASSTRAGIDVELASSVSPAARARRDNLDLFVKAVAEFQADRRRRDAARPARLPDGRGRLRQGPRRRHADRGRLGQAADRPPGQGSRVGRRCSSSGVCEERFPHTRGRGPVDRPRRACCRPAARRRRRPARSCRGTTGGARGLREDAKAHDATEELRLGYVAFTRAEHLLVVSSYCWGPARKAPLGPSPYQLDVGDAHRVPGAQAARLWLDKPEKDDAEPAAGRPRDGGLAVTEPHPEALRAAASAAGRAALDGIGAGRPAADDGLDLTRQAPRSREWDGELERLLAEARAGRADEIARPAARQLSATALASLRDDPDALAERAGPADAAAAVAVRPGSAPGSTPGWRRTSASVRSCCSTPRTCRAAADPGIDDDADLAELIERFRAGPFAEPGAATGRGRRSPWCSAARSSAAGSTPSSRSRRRLPASSTGRPTARRRRPAAARGLPGRLVGAHRRARSSRSAQRSTTCATVSSSTPGDLPGRAGLEGLLQVS